MNIGTVLLRELREMSRRPGNHSRRMIASGVAIVFLAVIPYLLGASTWVDSSNLLLLTSYLLASILGLGACITASDAISVERRDRTLGLMMLTPLGSASVLLGKIFSRTTQYLMGILAILPLLCLVVIGGGVTLYQVVQQCLNLLAITLLCLASGLVASVLCTEPRAATKLGLFILTNLCFALQLGAFLAMTISGAAALYPLFLSMSGPVTLPVHPIWSTGSFGYYWIHLCSLPVLSLLLLLVALHLFRTAWAEETGRTWIGTRRRSPLGRTLAILSLTLVRSIRSWETRFDRSASGPGERLRIGDGDHPYRRLIRHRDGKSALSRSFESIPALLHMVCILPLYLSVDYMPVILPLPYVLLVLMELGTRLRISLDAPGRILRDRDSGLLGHILTTPLPGKAILSGLIREQGHSQRISTLSLSLCHLAYLPLWFMPDNSGFWETYCRIAPPVHLCMILLAPFEYHAARKHSIAWGLRMRNKAVATLVPFLTFGILPIVGTILVIHWYMSHESVVILVVNMLFLRFLPIVCFIRYKGPPFDDLRQLIATRES